MCQPLRGHEINDIVDPTQMPRDKASPHRILTNTSGLLIAQWLHLRKLHVLPLFWVNFWDDDCSTVHYRNGDIKIALSIRTEKKDNAQCSGLSSLQSGTFNGHELRAMWPQSTTVAFLCPERHEWTQMDMNGHELRTMCPQSTTVAFLWMDIFIIIEVVGGVKADPLQLNQVKMTGTFKKEDSGELAAYINLVLQLTIARDETEMKALEEMRFSNSGIRKNIFISRVPRDTPQFLGCSEIFELGGISGDSRDENIFPDETHYEAYLELNAELDNVSDQSLGDLIAGKPPAEAPVASTMSIPAQVNRKPLDWNPHDF
ncbi:hypothetical protein EV361DRAFT_874284 [Lentinula raphanica]|nr:hypothetical protein EV361DRAFT_874284 [Lentinula raphanica]